MKNRSPLRTLVRRLVREATAAPGLGRTAADYVRHQLELDPGAARRARGLYLDLLERALLNTIYGDPGQRGPDKQMMGFDPAQRGEGRDWPQMAHTMIGARRLRNVRTCVERVIEDGVRGDVIETGVWRGGSTILMRGVLKAYGVTDRTVWVADSFEGLPPPDPDRYPADAGDTHHTLTPLAISMEMVQAHFQAYDLLDDQVRFLKGWFEDTLPSAPIDALAVVRLDGDMYASTIQAIESLYPKLSVGGYLIVDDYGAVPGCKKAIHDYRDAHGIQDELQKIDWTGVFWRRSR